MAIASTARRVRQLRPSGLARAVTAASLALALGTGGLASELIDAAPALASTASLSSNITFFRQAGGTPYVTAAAIATETFGDSAPTVILTGGTSLANSLASSYLAGTEEGGAPILLTDPTALSPAAATALSDLHTTHVIIVGGTSSVSSGVQSALATDYHVTRIAGANRYATAEMIDTEAGVPVGTDSTGQATAILVSGSDFADAVAAAPLSYARHLPMVLTDPQSLSAQAAEVLSHDHIAHVIQVTTSGSIAPAVTQAVRAMGISVGKVAGADHSQTSTLLAADELKNYGFAGSQVDLASGTDLADALAGAASAGAAGGQGVPLLLTTNGSDPGSAPGWVASRCSDLKSANIFGSTGSLGASTAQLIGLACPSNASVTLSVAEPVPVATPGSATGTDLAVSPSTTLTATVNLCGAPGSPTACKVGVGQAVVFSSFPSRSGVCGSFDPKRATTDSSGEAQTVMTSGTTSGTCIVTATANKHSASLAVPGKPAITIPCAGVSCCGPIIAGEPSSALGLGCCYSPPCTSQVCPDSAGASTAAVVKPAIIICPLEPAAVS